MAEDYVCWWIDLYEGHNDNEINSSKNIVQLLEPCIQQIEITIDKIEQVKDDITKKIFNKTAKQLEEGFEYDDFEWLKIPKELTSEDFDNAVKVFYNMFQRFAVLFEVFLKKSCDTDNVKIWRFQKCCLQSILYDINVMIVERDLAPLEEQPLIADIPGEINNIDSIMASLVREWLILKQYRIVLKESLETFKKMLGKL